MEVIPAIDLREGRSVRLYQGEFGSETIYGDPLLQAEAYAHAGATMLHLVDLDAARTGEPVNAAVVAAILASLTIPVEVAGGVRSEGRAGELFELGAARVVLGTAALSEPGLLERLTRAYPGRIALGLDHRRGEGGSSEVAVAGWERSSGVGLLDAVQQFSELELGAIVVTDIARDGTLGGPDLEGYTVLLGATNHPLVASGGVAGPADLAALSALEVGGRRLAGAIVGRALLSGAMTLKEAMDACAP
jgi:phosphoribosylformimino-5-aminoimidazole carboxamide ribotide isomerase